METPTASALPRADSGCHPVFPFRNPMEEKPTLRQVFETEESPLLRFAYGLVGQRETAEDLVQETLLAAWRGLEAFEGRSSVRAWLYRIATNVCFDALNGRQRRARPMDMGPCGLASGPLPVLALDLGAGARQAPGSRWGVAN